MLFINVYGNTGTNYLSSPKGDDDRTILQAQKSATPWASLSKINSVTLAAGDVVNLKRGDVFMGTLNVGQSGTSGKPITYSAYGTGANPKISGFTTLGSWTNEGRGIYSASLTVPSLNMVTLDGVVRTMGRYPKAGTAHPALVLLEKLLAVPSPSGRKERFSASNRARFLRYYCARKTFSSTKILPEIG